MEKHAWKWLGILLLVALNAVLMTMTGPVDGWAREKDGAFEKQIQGYWTLVSFVNEQDGKMNEPFGPNPLGSMILTPDGRFSLIIIKAGLPKFASNNRLKGTVEENQTVAHGTIAYFGSYKVIDAKSGNLSLHYDGSTFPNWTGVDLERIYTVTGDKMKENSSVTSIDGTNTTIWKRIK